MPPLSFVGTPPNLGRRCAEHLCSAGCCIISYVCVFECLCLCLYGPAIVEEVVLLCEVIDLVVVDAVLHIIDVCVDVHHIAIVAELRLGHPAKDIIDVGDSLFVLGHVCECLSVRDTGGIEPPPVECACHSVGHLVCLNRFCLFRS